MTVVSFGSERAIFNLNKNMGMHCFILISVLYGKHFYCLRSIAKIIIWDDLLSFYLAFIFNGLITVLFMYAFYSFKYKFNLLLTQRTLFV